MPTANYYDQYAYLDAVADIFSNLLNARKGSAHNPIEAVEQSRHAIDLQGMITWRGDTAKGYGINVSVDCDRRKTLIYLLSWTQPEHVIQSANRPQALRLWIDKTYHELLPLIEQAEQQAKEMGRSW